MGKSFIVRSFTALLILTSGWAGIAHADAVAVQQQLFAALDRGDVAGRSPYSPRMR